MPSNTHDPVELALSLNEKGKIAGQPPRAKVRNFLPRREAGGALELSTFCVDDLQDGARWELLQRHSNKVLVGRSEFTVQAAIDAGLVADPDWDPERHVNLLGWPDEEEVQKNIAQELHDAQKFVAA